jgi:ATP-binding cassette subfamily C protein CydC
MSDAVRLLRLFRPYGAWMVGGVVLAAITVLANVGLMAISGWFITAMALAGASGTPINYFTPAALIRALAIARSGGRYLERVVTHEATFRLLAVLRVRVFAALEPLVPAGLPLDRSGDLLGRVRADVDGLADFYVRLAVPVAAALLTAAVVTAVLASLSLALAATTLAWLAIAGVLVPLWVQRVSAAQGGRLVAQTAELRARLVEHVQHLAESLLFGVAERQRRDILSVSDRQIAAQRAVHRRNALSQAGIGLIANLATWTALLILVPLTNAGLVEPATLPAWTLLVLSSFEAVGGLPAAAQQLAQVTAAARRLFALTDRAPPVVEPAEPLAWPSGTPTLALRGLSFRYDEGAPWALRDVDLELPAGGRLAIVGASGSGKTTLVNLLARFWDYRHGSILLAGQELRRYGSDAVRRHVAVVPQRPTLLTGTIRDNLRLAAPQADQARLEAACRTAQIHEFIASQPAGYDTFVGEAGVRLSGGQIRRIAVAQALLKDAPILVLDEPGEDLDAPTEHAMLAAIDAAMAGRSVVVITHRWLPRGMFDQTVVLGSGRIMLSRTAADEAATRARPGALDDSPSR